jgi:hypothetical protein
VGTGRIGWKYNSGCAQSVTKRNIAGRGRAAGGTVRAYPACVMAGGGQLDAMCDDGHRLIAGGKGKC